MYKSLSVWVLPIEQRNMNMGWAALQLCHGESKQRSCRSTYTCIIQYQKALCSNLTLHFITQIAYICRECIPHVDLGTTDVCEKRITTDNCRIWSPTIFCQCFKGLSSKTHSISGLPLTYLLQYSASLLLSSVGGRLHHLSRMLARLVRESYPL